MKKSSKKENKALNRIAAMIMLNFFTNTGYVNGKPGMSKVFFAPLDTITVQPEPPAPGTGVAAGDTAKVTTAWTFSGVDAGFVDLKNDLLKGSKLEFTFNGDLASPSLTSKLSGRVIGLNPEIVERFRDMAGTPMVFAVQTPECSSDEYWIVGCACSAAYCMPKGDTDELGGTKGKVFEFEVTANCAPYQWTGTLPLQA